MLTDQWTSANSRIANSLHWNDSYQKLPRISDIVSERCRRSLKEFTKQAWHVIEPATPYIESWHLDAIFDHLTAVSRGQIHDLVINIPPRHMKSIAVCVLWPAWDWIDNPHIKWLFSSYSGSLSIRDSLKCRRLIQSPWYQAHFGHAYRLTDDQNAKIRFENDKSGYRIATSVGGVGTGEGGDRIIVDDPHNVVETDSDVVRNSALTWWDEAMSTRGNDPKTAARVIVMQRVHEHDLTGHVLAEGGYEHLCLPAEFELTKLVYVDGHAGEGPAHTPTSIGFVDPRAEEGELLCPKRFGHNELRKLKRSLGTYGTACQLQQRPAPRGGGLLRGDMFPRYKYHPELEYRAVYGDTAQKTAEHNDWTVFGCAGKSKSGRVYLLDLMRIKVGMTQLEHRTVDFWNKHKSHTDEFSTGELRYLKVEDKVSGTGLIQRLKTKSNIPVREMTPKKDKYTRLLDVLPFIESGMVHLPEHAAWVSDFIAECEAFSASGTHAHDDIVDVLVYIVTDMLLKRKTVYDNL